MTLRAGALRGAELASRIRPALAALACAALLATGCLGRSPKPELYTLTPTAMSQGAAVAQRPDLGLAVGPLELPRAVDRPELVTRDGANRFGVAPAQRWGGSLRSDVLRVVADDLSALLGTTRVVSFPAEPRFPLRYRVLLDVRQLDGVPGGSVTLRARWTVLSGKDGRAVAVEETDLEQPTASASWEDFVAAHGVVLGALSREIAVRIAGLPET